MLFTERLFFLFFSAVFPIHWVLSSNRLRKLWLLGASYVFYGAWNWRFLGLILASTVIDFFVGLRLDRTQRQAGRRALLALSLSANLGILGFFKYWNFFVTSLGDALSLVGITQPERTLVYSNNCLCPLAAIGFPHLSWS